MGIGTQTIKPVDKLFGPGNAFVIEAKRRLFGSTGVDLLPGPSEVLVMADSSSNPRFVVADLLSQAEHGSGREKIFLVSTSKKLVEKVRESLPDAAAKLSRTQMLMKIIADGCIAIIVPNLDAACEVANFISPEHMELMTDSPEKLVPKIRLRARYSSENTLQQYWATSPRGRAIPYRPGAPADSRADCSLLILCAEAPMLNTTKSRFKKLWGLWALSRLWRGSTPTVPA